jgi:Rod binding domain-containing protein
MSSLIAPVAGPGAAIPVHTPAEASRSAKVTQAAHDFESVLVRQLLRASKIGGDSKGGYGDMALDALADGVEKGGGLGLAHCIAKALGGQGA